MKKLIILTIIALSVATQAYAVTGTAASGVGTVGGEIVRATLPATLDIARCSKGVVMGWNTAATGYSINTYHTSGTKFYGTAYDSTALYFDDVGVDQTLAAPSDSSSDVAFSGWTIM